MSNKPLASLFLAASVAGAFSYAHTKSIISNNNQETALMALEALRNAGENFNYLVKHDFPEKSKQVLVEEINVNDRIVNVIESEIKKNILINKRKVANISNIQNKSHFKKISASKVNWHTKTEITKAARLTNKIAFSRNTNIETGSFKFETINEKDNKIETIKFNDYSKDGKELLAVATNSSEYSDFQLNDEERQELAEFKAEIAADQSSMDQGEMIAKGTNSDELLSLELNESKASFIEKNNAKKDEEKNIDKQFAAVVETDEVNTQMASAMKIENQNEKPIETKNLNDDLVMFDYSNIEKITETKTKKIFDQPLSETVKEAIQREVRGVASQANHLINPSKKAISKNLMSSQEIDKTDLDQLVFDYSKSKVEKNEYTNSLEGFTSQENNVSTQASLKIKSFEVNLNTHKIQQATGFEFVPDYERSERVSDQVGGEVEINSVISNDQAIMTGVVQSKGFIPTRIELNLLNRVQEIPLFNEVGTQKFLEKKKIMIIGNIIVVALSDDIVDIDLDTMYQTKLFFDKNFRMVDDISDANYVMMAGIVPGNQLLKYSLKNKEIASKIIYVGDGEIYYDEPSFVNKGREIYTLNTRSLLGKKVKELNISTDDVKMFGSMTSTKKKSINSYELKLPVAVNNNRNYLEFKHLGYPLYVGIGSKNELEIPGRDFISKVLNTFDLNQLGERCMLQINLSKDIRSILINGKNKSGEMFVESVYLDNEGEFSTNSPEMAEKVFVTGDQEGILSARLDYSDGTTDYLKSFCTQGSYLVEQL